MQYLSVSVVAKELDAEKIECDIHHGNEVGTSAVGELPRIKDKVNLHAHFICSCYAVLMLKPCLLT